MVKLSTQILIPKNIYIYTIKDQRAKLWNFFISSFAALSPFYNLYLLFYNLNPHLWFFTLGANLDILEDKNYKIEDD